MSRFINLEFEDESNRHRLPEHKLPVKDANFYLLEANQAFENGNFELALRHYGKVLEFDASIPSAWTGQVRMLIELGETKEAKLWADKALERFTNEPELLAAKAVALARLGEMDAALTFSDAAIEERGDSPYVWLARGDVLLARKDNLAQYCLDKAMTISPKNWVIPWLSARIQFYYDQIARALKSLEQALEWNPAHFLIWLERGRYQYALGLMGPAEKSFTQARQLNPHCDAAMTELGHVRNTGLWRRLVSWPIRFFK